MYMEHLKDMHSYNYLQTLQQKQKYNLPEILLAVYLKHYQMKSKCRLLVHLLLQNVSDIYQCHLVQLFVLLFRQEFHEVVVDLIFVCPDTRRHYHPTSLDLLVDE